VPITVFTTPTCPWCTRTKDFLQKQGAEFTERDVSEDRSAAETIMQLTGQLGVPVTTDGTDTVVGFDQPRLQAMALRNRRRGLGLRVTNAASGGALIGGVRDASPGRKAGLQAGDVVVELSGKAVQSADDLEQIATNWSGAAPTSITVLRDGDRRTLILYP
jgi:glutaredoxin 3